MTRDELIKEIAYQLAIEKAGGEGTIPDPVFFEGMAKVAIETVFYALKEPTEEMVSAGNEYGAFIGAYGIWKDMLSASPLAKDG